MSDIHQLCKTPRCGLDWTKYPYNQETYLPLREPTTEFGHEVILQERFSRTSSTFRLLQSSDEGCLNRIDFDSTSSKLDSLLSGKQPLLRVFVFSRDYNCTSKSWCLASDDLKRLFSHYHVQPSFLQRLKSFKFSASPEIYRSYKSVSEQETPLLKSHDLQLNINIPHTNCTIFCPSYFTYDTITNTQVLLVFNDTGEETPAQEFSAQLETTIRLILSKPLYRQSLCLNRFSLPVMVCGLVAEGWTQCTRELRNVQSDMEKMVQDTPDHNSWDLQKLFGHLSFRIPAMIAFRETLDLLKQGNAAFTSANADHHGGQMLIDDLVDHQLGLIRSVRRDFDYMRGRLEDLSALSFNLIAKQNSKVTAEIAEQNYRDAMSMRTIALVTLFFLPGTFISSIFSMSFFSNSVTHYLAQPSSCWLYFAVTIPLTACTIVVWTFWKRKEMDRIIIQRQLRMQSGHISNAQGSTLLGPGFLSRALNSWKLFHADTSARDTAVEESGGVMPAASASAPGPPQEFSVDTGKDMEKQTPVWYARSKAFAWKEDLELHWGDRGGTGGARLRRQLEQTHPHPHPHPQVSVPAHISERGRATTMREGEDKRGPSAMSTLLARTRSR